MIKVLSGLCARSENADKKAMIKMVVMNRICKGVIGYALIAVGGVLGQETTVAALTLNKGQN